MSRKIAVLYGGMSTEREVSLKSGQAIFDALREKGRDVILIDVDRNIMDKLREAAPDVAVIALHGKYGEDGCIQGMLEILGIPYTGPGVMASAIAMNKITTKKILCYEGIPTPAFLCLDGRESPDIMAGRVLRQMSPPVVVKAAGQGSSIGVCFAFNEEELRPAIRECLKYDREILVEQYVRGRELTVAVLGNDAPVALPVLEIRSSTGVYDYHAKYTAGASEHFVAELSARTAGHVKELAVRAYQAVGCTGLSRVDFLLTDDEEAYVLEVNTSPGMTATSLFPDAARAAGMSFPDLIEKIIELALEKSVAATNRDR